jgi:hypothetical protein
MSTENVPVADSPPTPPEKPLASDCCGGGCPRCVYDLYDEALEHYRQDLRAWQQRQDNPRT